MDNSQAKYDNERKYVGAVVLLWLFLGGLGVHRFYLGKGLPGLLLILGLIACFIIPGFIFVFAIWLIVDLFLSLADVREFNENLGKQIQSKNELEQKRENIAQAKQNPVKICPDCAEEVKAAAKKCRFCNFEFPEEEPKPKTSTYIPKPVKRTKIEDLDRPLVDGNRLDKL